MRWINMSAICSKDAGEKKTQKKAKQCIKPSKESSKT
jgi:hypothetical protein